MIERCNHSTAQLCGSCIQKNYDESLVEDLRKENTTLREQKEKAEQKVIEWANAPVFTLATENNSLKNKLKKAKAEVAELKEFSARQAAILAKEDCGCPCCERTTAKIKEVKRLTEALKQIDSKAKEDEPVEGGVDWLLCQIISITEQAIKGGRDGT